VASAPGRPVSEYDRLCDYVTVTGPTDGAPAPPEGGNVGYPPTPLSWTGTGAWRSSVVPSPSWPTSLRPQAQRTVSPETRPAGCNCSPRHYWQSPMRERPAGSRMPKATSASYQSPPDRLLHHRFLRTSLARLAAHQASRRAVATSCFRSSCVAPKLRSGA